MQLDYFPFFFKVRGVLCPVLQTMVVVLRYIELAYTIIARTRGVCVCVFVCIR